MNDMFSAGEIVCERQAAIVRALSAAKVSYALSGSNAAFLWIASVDESAVRQCRNVEFVIEQADSERVIAALAILGQTAISKPDHILFFNDLGGRDRWANRAIFTGHFMENEKYKTPSLSSVEFVQGVPLIRLRDLVAFQCSRWLIDDRVDLHDMIEVGLLDRSWLGKLPPELAARLQELLDNPDG